MRYLEESGATALKMDITKEEDIVDGVDILINNAGFGLYGAMEDIPLDEARYQFEVNLFGLARLTQLVLPSLGSPPSVIAGTIAKALTAKRPKTRYVAGQYARPLIFLRGLLSDRMYDRLIARMLR